MSALTSHDPYRALREPGFRRYLAGNLIGTLGFQMQGVAVGWELYERTHSALALGLVGLAQVAPLILFFLPAGHSEHGENHVKQITDLRAGKGW